MEEETASLCCLMLPHLVYVAGPRLDFFYRLTYPTKAEAHIEGNYISTSSFSLVVDMCISAGRLPRAKKLGITSGQDFLL